MESAKDERRRREGYDELDRIFEGTEKSLGSGNHHEADESLRRAGVKAVTMWAGLDRPPPAHIWLLIRLIWQLQTDINRPGQNSLRMLRTNLRELRYRFDLEARREKSGRVLLSKGWAEIGYSGLTRSVWLIAKNENGSGELLREPLTIGDDEDKALPVFSFREEAEMFLRLCGMGRDWRVQESAPAELVSMLYGPCANVNEVALDPLPEMVAERTIGFVSLAREHFVERFMVPRRLLGIREPVRESSQQRDTPRYGATPEDDERNPVRLLSEGGRRPLSRGCLREVRPRKSS